MIYEQGDIVLVPFPFTNLSTRKRRPGLIISPKWFNAKFEDVIMMAITSHIPEFLSELEVSIDSEDLIEGHIPKKSVVKIGKIFTMHRTLIVKKVGKVNNTKLTEVKDKLNNLFAISSNR